MEVFCDALGRDDVREAKSIAEMDPGLHNKQDEEGYTGLMAALAYRCHSLSRWLLSQPGLDTSLSSARQAITALHYACLYRAPLDIVIVLVRLSSWKNMRTTPPPPSISAGWKGAPFTSPAWRGARRHRKVTLHTWIDAGCPWQDPLFWAIAANVR